MNLGNFFRGCTDWSPPKRINHAKLALLCL